MARPSKFDAETILDQALVLAAGGGPDDVSMTGVAAGLGAPSGSIYYRFSSRDLLVASLWLRSVERFQAGFLAATRASSPVEAAVAAALYTVRWSRSNVLDAQLLLLHRRQDFIEGEWPESLVERNQRQEHAMLSALADLSCRLQASDAEQERVRFAVVGLAYGAVRPFLGRSEPPTEQTEELVNEAVRAVLRPFEQRLETSTSDGVNP